MVGNRDRPLDLLAALAAASLGFVGLHRLGLAPVPAVSILAAIAVGGSLDLPLPRLLGPSTPPTPRTFLNVGGGLIPIAFATLVSFGLSSADRRILVIDAAIVAAATWVSARREADRGIIVPWIYPGLLAAAVSTASESTRPAAVGYAAAVLGSFVGADLLHLRSLRKIGAFRVGIGGAGAGDGLVWSGLLAALIAGGNR